jgi:signal transduction histidine kinase
VTSRFRLPQFHSILGRVAALHVLVFAAAAIAVPLATYVLLSATATSFENQTLRAHADTIASYLTRGEGGAWALDLPPDLRTFYAHSFDGFAYAVVDARGHVISSSLRGGGAIAREVPGAADAQYFSRTKGRASYTGASIPVKKGNAIAFVQVAQDLEHPDVIFDDIVAGFLRRVVWFTIPIMVLLLIADIVIVRRALRPVVDASDMAASIGPERISVRLPKANLPSEIRPLVDGFNAALERLEEGFRRQREFTADAAHELRTPLAVLRTRLDTFADREAVRDLLRDIDAMSHVVNQLLDVSELEGVVVGPGERAELGKVCAEVAALVAPIAVAQGKEVALTEGASPVSVRGNAAMLFQAVRNLVENAIEHTPQGTTVEIVVDSDGKVRVIDEGPGVPPDERTLVFRRFWRRDRTRTNGSGLGLSIVARIAEAHGGSVGVESAPGGGAMFTLRLVTALSSSP